jgi:AcrR family transcriptional regulator
MPQNKTMKTGRVLRVLGPDAPADDPTRRRILDAARSRFLRFGLTPVTTDAIASSIGISKATLYKHFPSKERLFREVIFQLLGEIEAGVDALVADRSRDFAGRLAALLSYMGMRLTELGGIISLDMQRSAPGIWKDFEAFRRERIFAKLGLLLDEGRAQGVFRRDLNKDYLILVYATIIEQVINPAALAPFALSLSEAFRMIVSVMLEGLLTEKGRAGYLRARSRGSAANPRSTK